MQAIAPDAKAVRPIVWLLVGISLFGGLLTAAGVATTSHPSPRALGYGLIMFLGGGFGSVFLLLWLRNSRLLVGGGVLGYRDALGRDHTWMSSDVGAVVRAQIVYTGSAASRPAIYVLGLDGRRLMAFSVMAWSPTAIEQLVTESGKQLRVHKEPMSAAAFRREYPRALSWASVHPFLVGVVIAIALIVLIPAIAILILR